MRTNIVLDPDLIREAQKYSTAATKRALVEEALRTFVAVRAEERRAATWKDRVGVLDRKLAGIVLRESPISMLRADRERR